MAGLGRRALKRLLLLLGVMMLWLGLLVLLRWPLLMELLVSLVVLMLMLLLGLLLLFFLLAWWAPDGKAWCSRSSMPMARGGWCR